MGGMVLETNMSEIMLRIEEQNKIEKEEVRVDFSLIPMSEIRCQMILSFLLVPFEGYSEVRYVL